MTKNVAASVRARLAQRAKADGRPFQELLQYYGLERFLYRFAESEYRDQFVLKGALLLRVWDLPLSRPTRDIDFLGRTDNSIENLEDIVRAVCSAEVEDDGLSFDPETVTGHKIKEDADYEGGRVRLEGRLDNARVPMQLDIAFGDIVHPPATMAVYPTLLDSPAPSLRVYPRETVVAEKFQAMVYLGTVNSRMKDFYDIWLLSRQFDFKGRTLSEAVLKTFANRATEIDVEPVALTPVFADSEGPERQWKAFVTKSRLVGAPATLGETVDQLRAFLLPVARALGEGRLFAERWMAPGPWR